MVGTKQLGRFSWCWILLLYLSVVAQPVAAAEGADLLWDFADHLYQEQDFYRALSEYQRFLFLFPTDSRVPEAELQIGRCYRREGKFQKAFRHLIRLHNRRAEEPAGRQALLEMVAIREEQGRYPEAIYWAKQFIERYPDYAELIPYTCVWRGFRLTAANIRRQLPPLSCSSQRAPSILGQDHCSKRWSRDLKQVRSPLPWQERCPRFYQVQGIFTQVGQARLLQHSC